MVAYGIKHKAHTYKSNSELVHSASRDASATEKVREIGGGISSVILGDLDHLCAGRAQRTGAEHRVLGIVEWVMDGGG